MFRKSYVYFHKASVSALNNNVISYFENGNLTCGIVHLNTVDLLSGPETTKLSYRKLLLEDSENKTVWPTIISTGFIETKNNRYLGVLKEDYFYLYESDGSAQLIKYHNNSQSMLTCFTSAENYVFFGNDSGEIIKMEIIEGKELEFRNQVNGHDSEILCMDSDSTILASSDDQFTVKFWSCTSQKLTLISKYTLPVSSSNQPLDIFITTMRVLTNRRVCAVADSIGRVLLINCETGRLLAEVCAHGRKITGMAYRSVSVGSASIPACSLLITVSEDSLCRVWKLGFSDLPADGDHAQKRGDKPAASISLIQTIVVPDQMLQGVTFTNRKGHEFIITSYDSNEAVSFVQI